MNRIIVIVGPTAVGKTNVAIELAKKVNGEIISADSVQIYNGLDIGSAKPTSVEMQGIAHHLLGVIDPDQNFSASDFSALAKDKIKQILSRGKTPIIAGGTGLYVNALIYDMNFGDVKSDENYRNKLEILASEKDNAYVHDLLREVDPGAAEMIHPNNVKRVIRALEINKITGKPMSNFSNGPQKTKDYDVALVGLSRNRELLYEHINLRVEQMLANGLVEEVINLKKLGIDDSCQSMQGIGYKEVLLYLDNQITYEAMVTGIKQNSRHYAKRQLTWFKRYDQMQWVNLDDYASLEEITREILNII